MSTIHATLRQQRDEFAERSGAEDSGSGETPSPQRPDAADPSDAPSGAVSLLPSGSINLAPPANWDTAIGLVEAAAAKIKAYENRFKAIEIDARAFIERVDAEQFRLNSQVAALEGDLRKAEDRALAAEAEVQAMKLETWEAKLSRRNAEKKLTDAELEIRTSQQYLGQIESILRGL